MSTRNLTIRMNAAMAGILMAEVRRRASGKSLEHHFGAAQRQIERALREVSAHPSVPVRTAMRRVLARHSLTTGIVKETGNDVRECVRQAVFEGLPGSSLIKQVEGQIARGEKPRQSRLKAARGIIYRLTYREFETWVMNHYRLGATGFSIPRTLIFAFPLLGLVREGFHQMDWSTEEMGIRNVRYRIFRPNPGLREMVEAVEAFLESPAAAAACDDDLNFTGFVGRRITALTTKRALIRNGLNAYKAQDYFRATETVRTKCFPFTKHPAAGREGPFAPEKSRILGELLTGFADSYSRDWETGAILRKKLDRDQLYERYSALVLYPETTGKALRDEVRRIYGALRHVNVDHLKINCPLVKTYGPEIFQDLFGLGWQEYLGSEDFRKGK
jgi:hypothetical protein